MAAAVACGAMLGLGCGGIDEEGMRDGLASLPFDYEFDDVSCSSGDAVAGLASSERASVRFVIVAAKGRQLGCDVPIPRDRRTATEEDLTMAFGLGRGRPNATAEITESIDCEMYKRASGEDDCPI